MFTSKKSLSALLLLAALAASGVEAHAQDRGGWSGWSYLPKFNRLFGPWSDFKDPPRGERAVALDAAAGDGALLVKCSGEKLDVLAILDGRARLLSGQDSLSQGGEGVDASIRVKSGDRKEIQLGGRVLGQRFVTIHEPARVAEEMLKSNRLALGIVAAGVATVLEFDNIDAEKALGEIVKQCKVPVS